MKKEDTDTTTTSKGDPVAIPLRSLEVLWHPTPLTERRIRPIAPNCSVRTAMVQALGQVMDRCKWMQGKENFAGEQVPTARTRTERDIKGYLSIIMSDKVNTYSQKLATGSLEHCWVSFDTRITDHMMDGSHNYDEIKDVKAQGSGSVQNLIRMMLEFSTPQLDQGNEQMSMESVFFSSRIQENTCKSLIGEQRRAAQDPATSSRWKLSSVKPILIIIRFLKSPLLMASKILVPVISPITSALTLTTANNHLTSFLAKLCN
ncbi:hypothetical protein Anapl_05902 [Anas platyrhynchos]|uniref:Uncharacterized protein n=1 Tax=Anas platyrhynchos TaxID=8839 RepID=R0JU79_ANAPL|nr:hypothetical protein Anapl_05902 [Anas platyrhynchos]